MNTSKRTVLFITLHVLLFLVLAAASPFVSFLCMFSDSDSTMCGDLSIVIVPYGYFFMNVLAIVFPFALLDALWWFSLIQIFSARVLHKTWSPRLYKISLYFAIATCVLAVVSVLMKVTNGQEYLNEYTILQGQEEIESINHAAVKCAANQPKSFVRSNYNFCLDKQLSEAASEDEALSLCKQFMVVEMQWSCIATVARQWQNPAICDLYYEKKDAGPCKEVALGFPAVGTTKTNVHDYCLQNAGQYGTVSYILCVSQAERRRENQDVCGEIFAEYDGTWADVCRTVRNDPLWYKTPLFPEWEDRLR